MAVSLLAGYALFKVRHPTKDLPLAGGKVYTYARNTTTNKTAWTDAAKTVAHPNPIILDPAGEAVIYWDGEYKVRVDDSDNVTVRTMDDFNLQASGSDTVSDQEGNQLVNGSFEIDTDGDNLPDGWDVTQNGTVAFDTSDVNHGGQSLKFTSIGAAGGGEIVSSAFLNVVEARPNIFRYGVKIDWTSGTCRVVGQVDWYSEAEVFISTTTMFTNDYTGDVAWANPAVSVTPPTGATKAKLKIIGISDGITGVGSIWLDNMMFYISNSLDLTQTNATQTVNSAVQFAGNITLGGSVSSIYTPSAAGGDKGDDSINVNRAYTNGETNPWTLLQNLDASSDSSVDFTAFSSEFTKYAIILDDVDITGTQNLRMQVSTDGGSTWVATSYEFTLHSLFAGSSTVLFDTGTGTAAVELMDIGTSVAATGISGILYFSIKDATSELFAVTGELSFNTNGAAGGDYASTRILGYHPAGDFDAVRILPTSGNMTGTARLYGIV